MSDRTAAAIRQLRSFAFVAFLLFAGVLSCGGDGPATPGNSVAMLIVSLSPSTLLVGQTGTATAAAFAADGSAVTVTDIVWASGASTIATVSAAGLVTGVSTGQTQILATVSGKQAVATVTVSVSVPALVPVSAVALSPTSASILAGQTQQLTATTQDVSGKTLTGRVVTWTSSNVAIATVSSTGLVTAIAAGTATITSTSEGKTATSAITVSSAISLSSIFAGYSNTCGLTSSGAAFCWGRNLAGQLGSSSTNTAGGPVPVPGSLSFSTVAIGEAHMCGLTGSGKAYCWGSNSEGQLGDGTRTLQYAPVAVATSQSFASITAGAVHTCATQADGSAWCWGDGTHGQLGGSSGSLTPFRVSGGVSFSSISAGERHTCGVSTAGAAYCWGENGYGELGDGTAAPRRVPTLVSSGVTFAAIGAGITSTCAVSTAGAAYCWGLNGVFGKLGDGSTASSLVPVPVAGGLSFTSVRPGVDHACGLTTSGIVYCWGYDGQGQLGTGSPTANSLVPVAVSGGLTFSMLAVSASHNCARSVSGSAVCWGANAYQQLGDNSNSNRTSPVPVAGVYP